MCAAQQSQCTDQDLRSPASIAVGAVQVEGGQELTEASAAAAKPAFQKRAYRSCELKDALADAAERVRRLFQEHGYFKAEVADPVTRPAAPDKVDVFITVAPGVVYRLGEIRFQYATVFPSEELRAAFELKAGDVFNARTFSDGLERLRRLYITRGYINFAPVPDPTSDEGTQTVSWTIDMDEGAPYKLGALILDGPEPGTGVGKRLLADWQPLFGQAYNPELLRRFLQEHAALLRVRRPDPERMFDVLLDNKDHIVTVRLNFPE